MRRDRRLSRLQDPRPSYQNVAALPSKLPRRRGLETVRGARSGRASVLRVDPEATGRPSYHPSVLLKLSIYGYLNRVQSSRRLEREACRNVEVMWLAGRLILITRRLPISARITGLRYATEMGPARARLNLTRVINILGVKPLIAAIQTWGCCIVRFGATRSLTADRARHVDSSSQL